MAQWVECLLCKREDLSLELRYIKRPIKKLHKKAVQVKPSAGWGRDKWIP